MKFCSFFDAWSYLNNHELFLNELGISDFANSIDIEVVKVNPETMEISDNDDENTKVQVWLECNFYDGEYYHHDLDLDCGGDTFEEAIVNLAELVYKKYDLNINCKDDDISEEFNELLNELAESLKKIIVVLDEKHKRKEED